MMMRRATNLAVVLKTLKPFSATQPLAKTNLQTALFSTKSNTNKWVSLKNVTFHKSRNIATGTVLFSVAAVATATAFVEECHAKDPVDSKFLPKLVVLYQYEACPFCNKVKAFLDYHDIPYEVVEVNPLSKKEIKWSDYKKVPILMVEGEQMVDSSDIIDKLDKKIHPDKAASVAEEVEEKKWRSWVDNHLVHILSPNIYRSTSEALESFEYITSHGNFSTTERLTAKYAGAAAMYFVSKKLKKKYNITDERASLYEAAETWVDALDGRDFLGGSKPNLADLAVYGVLRPIRYLKSGRDMVEHTRINDWYSRMERAVGLTSNMMINYHTSPDCSNLFTR